MARRPSMANGYQGYPTRMNNLEPIPMYNNNNYRVSQPYQPFSMGPSQTRNQFADPQHYGSTLSARSTRPLLQSNQASQPFYNNQPTSFWSQPSCLGLTRLSGGILFTTMIVLAAGSIAGLIVSAIFYVNDPNTDSQWKILGMVVSSIMFVTVVVTFCIFIYCYKQGRIVGSNNPNDPFKTQPFDGQGRDYDQNYPPPYYQPGMGHNMISPIPHPDDQVLVQDKLTNTQHTNAPFPPRDLQRGVWPSNNAYGGYAYRSNIPPKTLSRTIQASPTQFDQQNQLLRKNPMGSTNNNNNYNYNNSGPIPRLLAPPPPPPQQQQQPGTRIEYIEDDEFDRARRQRRALENPRYEIVEEIIERPRPDEIRRIIAVPAGRNGKDRSRYDRVKVKPISIVEKPNGVEDEYTTDHFYQ